MGVESGGGFHSEASGRTEKHFARSEVILCAGGRLSLEMNFLNSTALQGAPISSSPETSTNLLKVTGSSRRRTFAPKPRA